MSGSPKKKEKRERTEKALQNIDWWNGFFDAVSSGISMMEYCKVKDVPYNIVLGRIRKTPEIGTQCIIYQSMFWDSVVPSRHSFFENWNENFLCCAW